MAQTLPRKTLALFGAAGTTDDFEEFGSTAVGATNYTKDIETIQGLAAWGTGWRPALVTAKAPVLQDLNGAMYVHSYEQCYSLIEGLPEWDDGTTYDKGSIVKLPYTGSLGSAQVFVSLTDANLNNALPTAPASNANWAFAYGLTGTGLVIPGVTDGSSAAAGMVGEVFQSKFTVVPTPNQWNDGGSIPLTAGDWDVSYIYTANIDAATGWREITIAITSTPGNSATGVVIGDNAADYHNPVASGAFAFDQITMVVPSCFISLSSPATYYAKIFTLTASQATSGVGRITARRRR